MEKWQDASNHFLTFVQTFGKPMTKKAVKARQQSGLPGAESVDDFQLTGGKGQPTSTLGQKTDEAAKLGKPAGKKSVAFTDEEKSVASATARSMGAVGANAITPRYVLSTSKTGDAVLDYGSGPQALHAKALREQGLDVTAYDFGKNATSEIDPSALSKQYDTVYASNVMNVQSSTSMAARTLDEMTASVKPNGRLVVNLPESPRKAGVTIDLLRRPRARRACGGGEAGVGDDGSRNCRVYKTI